MILARELPHLKGQYRRYKQEGVLFSLDKSNSLALYHRQTYSFQRVFLADCVMPLVAMEL
jgi:hypothetical protein